MVKEKPDKRHKNTGARPRVKKLLESKKVYGESELNLTQSGKDLYKKILKMREDLDQVVKWNTSDGDMLSFVMSTRKSLVILANVELERIKEMNLDLGINE
jgi:hypothetical protein